MVVPRAAEEICCCDSARSRWRSWCEFGCRRAGGVGAADWQPDGGAASYECAVRVLRAGLDRGLARPGGVTGPAAAAGCHADRGARDDRGRVLRHRGEPHSAMDAAPAGRDPGRTTRGPGPRLGRDRDRGVRAGVLRQPVRVNGPLRSSTTASGCGCRRSAGESTGTPRTTSRPCSRSACPRNGRSPAPGSGSAPRWRTQTREQGRYLGGRPPYGVLPVVQDEHGGVIGVEHVLMLKSPARRSRAGLGVQGVAGMVSLSR